MTNLPALTASDVSNLLFIFALIGARQGIRGAGTARPSAFMLNGLSIQANANKSTYRLPLSASPPPGNT